MKYLSLDIETGGLYEKCSVLEVAFVAEDTDHTEIPVSALSAHVTTFRPDPLVIEPYAFSMHTDNGLLARCMGVGVPTTAAWSRVVDFLHHYRLVVTGDPLDKIVLAGKNVWGFDLKFFPAEIKSLFHYRTLDPGSMLIPDECNVPLDTSALLARCGMAHEGEHRAEADARDVIRLIRALRKRSVDVA